MKTQILAIGRHPEILATVVRLLNNNTDWHADGAETDDEALSAFTSKTYHLVMLGGGIEVESEDKLCDAFRAHHPAIIIVQHYGGGSGLLYAEVYEALK